MLQLFNAALLAQGQEEIVVESDGSIEWRLLARNWPGIVEAELEDGAYHFTREQEFLQTRSDGRFGFRDAFMVPPIALHVRRVWVDDRPETDWTQDGTHVHVDCPEGVWAEYLIVSNPDLWSANFSKGVQCKLEAVILRAIKEEFNEALGMEQQAEIYFQRARTNTSKARSAVEPYRGGRFGRARFGIG